MALGMQSGMIPDTALNASTSLSNHGPTNARYMLNTLTLPPYDSSLYCLQAK